MRHARSMEFLDSSLNLLSSLLEAATVAFLETGPMLADFDDGPLGAPTEELASSFWPGVGCKAAFFRKGDSSKFGQ